MKRTAAVLFVVLLLSAAWSLAGEKMKGMKQDKEHELKNAIERGRNLFMDTSLGTTGKSCSSCHTERGMKEGMMGDMEISPFHNLACKYPRYFKMGEKVMTLDQVINWCIMTPMEGKPLAWDDQRLADLAAYAASVNSMKEMPHEMHEHMQEHMEKEKTKAKKME